MRSAVDAIGLELFASVPSNATTAVAIPDGKAGEITSRMEHVYGVKIAGGQARLKGHIVRLGHLGYYNATDMFTMVSAFEATLVDLGLVSAFGPGVAALRQSYSEEGA